MAMTNGAPVTLTTSITIKQAAICYVMFTSPEASFDTKKIVPHGSFTFCWIERYLVDRPHSSTFFARALFGVLFMAQGF